MGDGINDVSALTVADIGISVANAVDAAREAADLVLMEKELSVLIDGIIEGRKTFANTLKYIFVNTGSTFGSMCSVALASLLLPFLPLLPKQILLINFMTDLPYLAISGDNVDKEQLTRPGKWDLKFIRNYMIVFGIHSSFFDIITFVVLFFILKVKEATFQTGWFIESVIAQLLILFIVRTQKRFFNSMPGSTFCSAIWGGSVTSTGACVRLADRPCLHSNRRSAQALVFQSLFRRAKIRSIIDLSVWRRFFRLYSQSTRTTQGAEIQLEGRLANESAL